MIRNETDYPTELSPIITEFQPEGFSFFAIMTQVEMHQHPELFDLRDYRILAKPIVTENASYFLIYQRNKAQLESLEVAAKQLLGEITNFLR